MKSPLEWKREMMHQKTQTTPSHMLHHILQPNHWTKRETHAMNRKGRK